MISPKGLLWDRRSQNADVVIVTDDNPRSEDPAKIRQMIIKDLSRDAIHEYGDRAEAILRAVDMLDVGDALIICGKGHETGQVIGMILFHLMMPNRLQYLLKHWMELYDAVVPE